MLHRHLASRFSRNRTGCRSSTPLTDDMIRQFAPSIFAEDKHASRSERYTYIPTSNVLAGLRKEGFQPFEVTQTKSRDETRRESSKHMIRLRHASQIEAAEAQEIILLNSHDGTSSYQMLNGVFRFVCANGLIAGDVQDDIRIPHRGDVVGEVIDGAYRSLDNFGRLVEQKEGMKAVQLDQAEQTLFAHAALGLKFDTELAPAPVTEAQILEPRRREDLGSDLWSLFNRVQENLVRGGLRGRNANNKPLTTREVRGIDSGVKINRALWTLAEGMRQLKGQ